MKAETMHMPEILRSNSDCCVPSTRGSGVVSAAKYVIQSNKANATMLTSDVVADLGSEAIFVANPIPAAAKVTTHTAPTRM